MYQKRRLKTLIISGRGMRKIIVGFACAAGIAAVSVMGVGITKLPSCSEDNAMLIIKTGLNDKEIIKADIIKRVFGFDIKDAKTILYKYYSQFGALEAVVEAVESAPAEPTREAEPPVVEEVNIAKGMTLSNSSGIAITPEELLAEPLHIKVEKGAPQILIVHTHTTESYSDDTSKFSASSGDRSTDSEKNMVAIGNVMQEVFTQRGIESVHDTTVHDYPSYNGAYTRSMTTMTNNLKNSPSIKIVLDVHRDGITRADGTKVKVTADIDGKKAAQCMFVVGTDAKLTHNTWRDNMRLACKLQNYANIHYPGLMRPINVRAERFNQQITSGSLIVEVGSNGNTLEEAKLGAEYMAEVIAAVLCS